MPTYLFIAEKPSLMRDVKKCYEKHKREVVSKVGYIDFTALSGHVCTFYEPNDYEGWNGKWDDVAYPIVPNDWGVKPINDNWKKSALKKIKDTVGNYDGVIVGTDSDVEGYGIYYLLETYLGLQDVYALRFIEHSLAEADILKSLFSMTDYHKDELHKRFVQSFIIRSRSDWLFGMNATRMMTLKLGTLMTIGRVKAPTINLVYQNSKEIDEFQAREYYQLYSDYGDFQAVHCDEEGAAVNFDKLGDLKKLQPPKDGMVTHVESTMTERPAPQLYDLSSLQIEAGQMLHLTPDEVMEIVQSLYEKHKVISYPRTQCRYVSSEKAKEFPAMLSKMAVFPELAGFEVDGNAIKKVMKNKRIVNDAEVEKEAHDALLPTDKTPDLSKMTDREVAVCRLIYTRLLAQFMPTLKEEKTKLIIHHGDIPFMASGKRIQDLGWRQLYGPLRESVLPPLEKGTAVTAKQFGPVARKTQPPRRLTQATLVSAMEHIANKIEDKTLRESLAGSKGIGTPATRHAVIADIIKRGYVEDRKGLYITEKGKLYIESLRDIPIVTPEFAAVMDYDIKKIQRGEESFDVAWKNVLSRLQEMCDKIEAVDQGQMMTQSRCPKCGELLRAAGRNYLCDGCGNKIKREIAGVDISPAMLEDLINGEIFGPFKFRRKDGTTFKARLRLIGDGELKFVFGTGIACPLCGKELRSNRGGFFCDCGLSLYRKVKEKTLTDKQLEDLATKGHTKVLSGFKKKDGDTFSARLVLEKGQKYARFSFKD